MIKVGFIGLGIMGKPMALRLHAAKVDLTVYARRPERRAEFASAGVSVADSPRQLTEDIDIVFLMVSDTHAVEDLLFSATGIAPLLKRGALVVDMSTIDPTATRNMADCLQSLGIHMLDAPVSGGEQGAIAGTLSIMAGGSEESFQLALPFLQHLAKNIVHVGDHGAGQIAKACNQLVVAQTLTALAEAFTLARCAGVDPAIVRRALLGGFAYSRALEVHGERMLSSTYTPGFKSALHSKDLNIVLDFARHLGLELPGATLSAQWMNLAQQHYPDADSSVIYELIGMLNTPPPHTPPE